MTSDVNRTLNSKDPKFIHDPWNRNSQNESQNLSVSNSTVAWLAKLHRQDKIALSHQSASLPHSPSGHQECSWSIVCGQHAWQRGVGVLQHFPVIILRYVLPQKCTDDEPKTSSSVLRNSATSHAHHSCLIMCSCIHVTLPYFKGLWTMPVGYLFTSHVGEM